MKGMIHGRHCVWAVCAAIGFYQGAVAAAGPPEAKLDPRLYEAALAAPGAPVEWLIELTEQADLSGAARLRGKRAKGRFVFERLRETASRTQPRLITLLKQAGLPYRAFWGANVIWTRGSLETARTMAARTDVGHIYANVPVAMELPLPEAGPGRGTPAPLSIEWGVSRVRATNAWALGFTGQGVIIGGQDTGYDWDHPALKRQYLGWDGTNADHNYHWHDAIHSGGGTCGADAAEPCDDHGHGTHTMGTMLGDDLAGNQVGVAPGARWIGCRNMNVGYGTPATYTECFEWFIAPTDLEGENPDPDRAPDVISNSWGCPSSEGCIDPNALSSIVHSVRSAGIVIVASAGNNGAGCGTVSDPPAIYDDSFTIGNTDSANAIYGSSSRGPVTVDGSNRMKPDLSAPGTSIRSSLRGGSYGNMTGTSMAAPHVAGVVALLLSAHPGLGGEVARIERLLTRTATPLRNSQVCGGISSTNVPNNTFGWGLVDAHAALGLEDDDGDELPNWWEIAFDLNPTDKDDAGRDADEDGFSNHEEYTANTDPRDPDSGLRMTSVSPLSAGGTTITWITRPDGLDGARRYRVYRTTSLTDVTWTTVASNMPPTGDATVWTDLSPPPSNAFYRIGVSAAGTEVLSPPRAAH
jgi:subtilisin family serine protease